MINNAVEWIERLGHYVQIAITEFFLPSAIEILKSGGICDCGAFMITAMGFCIEIKFSLGKE